MSDQLMEGIAKFLDSFQNLDKLDEGSTKGIEEEMTEKADALAEKDIRPISEENTIIEEKSKLEKIPKSEENELTQQSLHKTEVSIEKKCGKESPENKTYLEENNNEIVNISQPKDKVPKFHDDELSINYCINPIEEETKKEDEKRIKSSYTEERKDDSITDVPHEDEVISVRCCQNDLMIDLHEESDVAISENVDECDKDEKDQEEPMSCHPYSFLIENFELTKEQKMQTKIGPPKSLKETPVQIVYSRISLLKLLPILNSAKEIALRMQIDNNQFEPSIQLMAISTRDTDYIIDVAKVNKDLLLLTEIFINPKIVKIIFGAGRVLSTLQNILHLYVVNIFDCEKAGKALQTGYKSIDMILKKEYSYKLFMRQVDCRSRPFSPQYQDYCRAIPHYLIYMYHDYKNKLLSKDENLYKKLMAEFREASKIIYPQYRTTQLLSLEEELQNHHKCQLEVLEKLNEWRNDAAIKLNKNPLAIIPKSHLITLSSILPITEFSLCCISKSPFVKEDAEKILAIIKEARVNFHLEEKLMSSKKKQDFKYLLWKELNGSNLNVDRKMSNKFEKIGEVVTATKRNKPGEKKRKRMKKCLTASPPKSQQNTNNCKTVNDDSLCGIWHIDMQTASPVMFSSQKACASKDSSSNRNSGSSNVAENTSLSASDSYNVLKIQKRINTLKRELSLIHEGTDVDHNLRKKRS